MNTFPFPNVKRFNFTYAMEGGAWLESGEYLTSIGKQSYREWIPFQTIIHHMGKEWLDTQMKKQSWMTGCWIDCVTAVHREPLKPVAVNGVPTGFISDETWSQ